MSARIFVHPRSLTESGNMALHEGLVKCGIDVAPLCLFPFKPGQYEIVKHIAEADGVTTYERGDETRFNYGEATPPGAA